MFYTVATNTKGANTVPMLLEKIQGLFAVSLVTLPSANEY